MKIRRIRRYPGVFSGVMYGLWMGRGAISVVSFDHAQGEDRVGGWGLQRENSKIKDETRVIRR